MPEQDFLAVGEEDEWINAVRGLDAVGVVGGLTFAFQRTTAGALRFDDSERDMQTVEENVVGEFVACSETNRPIPKLFARYEELFNILDRALAPAGTRQLVVDPLPSRLFGLICHYFSCGQ